MWNKIKKLFNREQKAYVTAVALRADILATDIELYRKITIMYLKNAKTGSRTYYYFYKKDVHAVNVEDDADIKVEAHNEIDQLL